MAERDLVVRFIGDERDLLRAFVASERQAASFQGLITGVTSAVLRDFLKAGIAAGATAVSFQAVTAAIGKSVTAASDLNEQISRTEVILGENARATIRWSETTADSFGISQRAALAASATFAGLFQTVGVGAREASELSRSLVELAADLASLQNTSPEDALLALRSGLVGEAEPLRRFNIFLSETRVQLLAMARTGKDNASALTAQEKALARYEIILRDSEKAQGNFALTSGELANQSRILRANLDDLSANLGGVLIPVLTEATGAANDLFEILDQFRGVDFSPRFDFPEPPGWLRGAVGDIAGAAPIAAITPAGAYAVAIKRLLEDEEKAQREVEQAASPGRGIGEHIAQLEEERAREMERAQREAKRAQDRQRRAFDAFVKGMGLKLSRAGLTEGLDDDLAVLREIERAILRQIEREGRTFKLVEQLTEVRLRINDALASRAADAAAQARDAWQETLDALDLNLERARDTAGFQDDLRALRDIEQKLTARIREEGRTIELERQLLDVRRQQAEVRRQQAEQLREARQGRQFVALGLTEEGEERTPGVGALRRRLQNLREQVKGTVLDTEKTRSQLQQIAKVLSGEFGAVGKEVRQSILQMFNDISDALESGGGPDVRTKFQKRGIGRLLEGLGLSAEEERNLRARFAELGPGGVAPGQGIGAFGFALQPGTRSTFATENQRNVEEFHIYIDGEEVESRVTRRQQKKDGRTAKQRRGVRAGR